MIKRMNFRNLIFISPYLKGKRERKNLSPLASNEYLIFLIMFSFEKQQNYHNYDDQIIHNCFTL
jgi:hypothetical protein